MKCLLFLLLTVLSSASLSAQAPTAQKEKEKELERLRLRAVSMIEQTAAETLLWDDRKAAAELKASYWDPLWQWSQRVAVSGRGVSNCIFRELLK